jgi:hypothetical protein
MPKCSHRFCLAVLALAAGAGVGRADDRGPTLQATQQWLSEHENDFTSSFSFTTSGRKGAVCSLTIQGIAISLARYDSKRVTPGCHVVLSGNSHETPADKRGKPSSSDVDYSLTADFRAEMVKDAVEIRKLDGKDIGANARNFDPQGCYCLVIAPLDANSNAVEMTGLGAGKDVGEEALHYIVIPIKDHEMAQRLANALHHGIQLIQAEAAANPEPF